MRQRRRSRSVAVVATAVVAALAMGCSTKVGPPSIAPTSSTAPPHLGDEVDETAAVCTVTLLLEPTCGAWLGAAVSSLDGRFDAAVGLDEYMSATGHDPDIVHLYRRGNSPFPTDEQRALIERDGRSDRLFYFSWKPSVTHTWREVADGAADEAIDTVAASLMEFGEPLFLTVFHEPENDVVDEAGSGMTPGDYVDMYRYVVTRLRELGVRNAVYVMTFMGFDRWASIVDDLYPGDDVVDWIGYDPYGRLTDQSFADFLNRPNDDGWPGFYEWAAAKSPGTPIMLAEWGFDLAGHDASPDLLTGGADVLRTKYPEIAALVYWNGLGERVDARLQNDTELAARFAAAYGTFASDPYFEQPDLESLP